MPDIDALHAFLGAAYVEESVFALCPDYRALLVAVDGITSGPGDAASEVLLRSAEAFAREAAGARQVSDLPHIAAWRDAYRAFGAKPQRTRNSLEALTRRALSGLPRVNRLTDIYNAISVLHQIPLGGEDLSRYRGALRLIRSTGREPFDTVAAGEPVVEHPDPGEVVWCDELGVTCRRWNWRQGRRTRLTDGTSAALFVLDVLDPTTDTQLDAAADALLNHLGPDLRVARRLLGPDAARITQR